MKSRNSAEMEWAVSLRGWALELSVGDIGCHWLTLGVTGEKLER